MDNEYIFVQWPDSQLLIERAINEGWEEECFLVPSDEETEDSACFVLKNRLIS